MKSGRARRFSKAGHLLFFAPIAAIAFLVVFGLLGAASTRDGTLVVEAVSSGRYAPSVPLHISATVEGKSADTPFNATLPQGYYTVTFGSAAWYLTPPPRSVSLRGGGTAYAVGTFDPVLKIVEITQTGFNSTSVSALHGVTPVVWINKGGSGVTLEIAPDTRIYLQPSQNYTTVFQAAGTYGFSVFNTDFVGSVNCE